MAKDHTIKIKADTGDAVKEIDKLADGVKQVDEGAKDSKSSFAVMKKGVQGVGLAFKAMGIGLIVGALMTLKDMFMSNQVIMDKVAVAGETMKAVFQSIINVALKLGEKITSAFTDPKQAISDLWEALKKNIVNRVTSIIDMFGALGKVIKGVFTRDMDLLKEGASEAGTAFIQMHTGMDKVQQSKFADTIKKGGEEIKKTTQEATTYAKALVKLRNEVKLAEAEQRKLQFTYLKEAEIQRQVRDDVSKTIDERIEANNKLKKVLDEQFAEEKKLALEKVKLAEMELANNKTNIELQVALTNAETELLDLEERITGQRSEMLVNEVSLNDERIANMQELSSIGKSEIDKQLNDLTVQAEQQRELAKRTISDEQLLADTLVKIDEEEKREKQKILDEQEQALKDQKAEEEKIRNEAINEVRNATMEQRQIELNNAEDKYQKLLALATKYGEDTTELTKQYNQQVADINAQFDDEEIAKQKTIQDEKFALANERVDQAQEIMGLLAEISQQELIAEKNALQEQLDAGLISQEEFNTQSAILEEEAVKREKKNAMLQILIDTAQAVAGAINAGSGLVFPANLGAIATGIIAVLSGIAQAKTILNQVPGGSGGGTDTDVSTPQQGGGLGGLIPQFENIAPPEPTNNQPVQAFVVETDISNAQALQEELDIQATL